MRLVRLLQPGQPGRGMRYEGQMYALPDVQILAIRAVVNNAAPAVRGLQKLLAEMKGAD